MIHKTTKNIIHINLAILSLTLNSCCLYFQSLIAPNGIETIEINQEVCKQEEKTLYKNDKNNIIKVESTPTIVNTISITTKDYTYLFDFNKLRRDALRKYGIIIKNEKHDTLYSWNLPKNNSIVNNLILHKYEIHSTRFVLLFYPCGLLKSSINVLYDKNGHVNLNINNNLVIKPDRIMPIKK